MQRPVGLGVEVSQLVVEDGGSQPGLRASERAAHERELSTLRASPPRILCQRAAMVRSVGDPNEVILVAETIKSNRRTGFTRWQADMEWDEMLR